MNRIEKMLEEAKEQLGKYQDDRFWVDTYGKRVAFFKWLLEESEDVPIYELHQKRVSPTVWGMGDVTYHANIQLNKIKTPSQPIFLVFDYHGSASSPSSKGVYVKDEG